MIMTSRPDTQVKWYLTGLEHPISSCRFFAEEIRSVIQSDVKDEFGYKIVVFDRYDPITEEWYTDQAPLWKLFSQTV